MHPVRTMSNSLTWREWVLLVAGRAVADPRTVERRLRSGGKAVNNLAGQRIDRAIAQLAAEGFEQPAAPEMDRAA